MELVYDHDALVNRERCELRDEQGSVLYWGIYDFAFKYRTRIFDGNDDEVSFVQKDLESSLETVGIYDPADRKKGELLREEGLYLLQPEGKEYRGNIREGGIPSLMKVENGTLFVEDENEVLKAAEVLFALAQIDRKD